MSVLKDIIANHCRYFSWFLAHRDCIRFGCSISEVISSDNKHQRCSEPVHTAVCQFFVLCNHPGRCFSGIFRGYCLSNWSGYCGKNHNFIDSVAGDRSSISREVLSELNFFRGNRAWPLQLLYYRTVVILYVVTFFVWFSHSLHSIWWPTRSLGTTRRPNFSRSNQMVRSKFRVISLAMELDCTE